MIDDAGWRDVTPTTLGFEFEVQMHQETGKARHRQIYEFKAEVRGPFPCRWTTTGPWLPGWPGKGLQW